MRLQKIPSQPKKVRSDNTKHKISILMVKAANTRSTLPIKKTEELKVAPEFSIVAGDLNQKAIRACRERSASCVKERAGQKVCRLLLVGLGRRRKPVEPRGRRISRSPWTGGR